MRTETVLFLCIKHQTTEIWVSSSEETDWHYTLTHETNNPTEKNTADPQIQALVKKERNYLFYPSKHTSIIGQKKTGWDGPAKKNDCMCRQTPEAA